MSGTTVLRKRTSPGVAEAKEIQDLNLGKPVAKAKWSSGCVFYPSSDKFWRIGGNWYDFDNITNVTEKPFNHPGGHRIIRMARDRFEDATYPFESHHHEYQRVRAIIRKYQIHGLLAAELSRRAKAIVDQRPNVGWHDRDTPEARKNGSHIPLFTEDKAFYSVVRKRVSKYLKSIGHRHGGPTVQCVVLFWLVVFGYFMCYYFLARTASLVCVIPFAFFGALLGAFGHNWIHQPHYKLWAYISLDVLGMSSDQWYREHVLQHHMYTNTPWDNHFCGTEPFLVTDPTRERNCIEKYLTPYLNPLILTLGIYANYTAHAVEMLKGNERIQAGKLLFPMFWGYLPYQYGWWGVLLAYLAWGLMGIWYFSMALMNHNAAHTHDVQARNNAKDWGIAQLNASADFGTNLSFLSAGRFLWLNFHTVHHLFPRTDFSHHPAIQQILMETCKEYNVKYVAGNPWQIYKEMVVSFSTPRALLEEVSVYGMSL